MSKTLNELSIELKEYIIEMNSDAHNRVNFRPERYHNMKFEMDVAGEKIPHVIIKVSMSSAMYNINSMEKMSGSLGVDDKFVPRWMGKPGIIDNLNLCWKRRVENRGKITDVKE